MFTDPIKNVEQFGLQSGMRVADLGAGSGFYAKAAARAVGSAGRVYAVDIQKELLTKIKTEAAGEKLFNIEVIWGDIEKPLGTSLRDGALDAVILSNILFQLRGKSEMADEVKRILKPGGRVLVVDWTDSFGGLGPQPGDIVSRDSVKELFEPRGFVVEKEIQAGAHHFGLILKKA
ncbi:methyltransferase domain-containing protein [Patescibacteria group bacterium]|nr:MAG: methyltransferase domain-containing protein [Patescibacteria group bacterium]